MNKIKAYLIVYANGEVRYGGNDLENNRAIWYHVRNGARIAEIEIDFDELPEPKAVFGKGIVINQKETL